MIGWGFPTISAVSREAAFGNDTVERSLCLVKVAYDAMIDGNKSVTHERAMIWESISRNLTINVNSGLSPSMLMLGRSDLLESLGNYAFQSIGGGASSTIQQHIIAVSKARGGDGSRFAKHHLAKFATTHSVE